MFVRGFWSLLKRGEGYKRHNQKRQNATPLKKQRSRLPLIGACTKMVRQREGREKTKAPAPATKKRETSEERKKREDAEVRYDVAPRPIEPL